MKKLTKLSAVLLMLALLVMSAATTSFAATDFTNHTYKAYQVFAGTQSESNANEDGVQYLGDIVWGKDVASNAFIAELKQKYPESYSQCVTAKDVAEVLDGAANGSEIAYSFAEVAEKYVSGGTAYINGTKLDAGYYVIIDTTTFLDDQTDMARNLSLVQQTKSGTVVIAQKNDVPSVSKKVWENDYNGSYESAGLELKQYNDVADFELGDSVPFVLIGTMPSTLDLYKTYKYTFHDTLSAGLTFDADSVRAFVVNNGTAVQISEEYYSAREISGGFDIAFSNVKSVPNVTADSEIFVYYNATLNENSIIGQAGNPNEVYLEYSNNPNFGDGGDYGNEETGKTPKDTVVVYTYEFDATKVDSDGNKISGAEFVLYKKSGESVLYYSVANNKINWVSSIENATILSAGDFKVKRIADGTYYLEETKAPNGYNKLDKAIEFSITATIDNGQDWERTATVLADGKLTALKELSVEVNNSAVFADSAKANVSNGTVQFSVINENGSILPGTGGVGTVIMYIVGSMLVFGGVTFLIVRKKVNR